MKKCSILIVEDEALIAANLVHTLSSLGYTVHKPVATGEDAIRAVKAQHTDLVLMDIELIGEMNGIEAAEKIRAIADIPIVYLTAYTDDLRLKQARLTEPYGYIVKPAHSRELHATIEMALYKHGLDRKLKVSEENYRKISTMMHLMCDNMPDMIWAKDLEKRYIFANKTICHNLLNAAGNDEPIGKNDMFFAERERTRHADDPEWHTFGEICRDTDQITMDAGIPQQFNEYGNVQGKFLFLDVHKAPFIDEQGIMIGTVGSARDVTVSKQLEEALAESEERFRLLLQHVPSVSVQGYSMDGTTQYWNVASESLYGYTAQEAVGKNLVDLIIPPEMKDDVRKAITCMAESGQPIPASELSLMRKDGSRVAVFSSHAIVKRAGGGTELFCIDIDLTDRKRAEVELLESRQRFQGLVETLYDWIWEVDYQGRYTYVSPRIKEVLGYEPEELLGKTPFDIMPDEEMHRISELFGQFIAEQKPIVALENICLHKDGHQVIMETNSLPFYDTMGNYKGYRGTDRDITERKELEKEKDYQALELKKVSSSLAAANKKLNLLSSITRHDINNQLTVLQGYLTILKMKQPDPILNEYCSKAATAAQRISSMIQFTKEYDSIGVNAPVWLDSRTLVDTAAKQAPLGKVIVKNDLPAGQEVFADPLIVKVFYNLMDNAVRYGGKITTLRFCVEERDGVHFIVCEDDGDGVVAEEKEKIFERGFGKNTGLGLALSREILDITGISIKETGEPGKGARFEITVPKGACRFTEVR